MANKTGLYNITISREFWQDLEHLPPAATQHALHTARRMFRDPWASELHPEKIKRAENGVYSCRVDDGYRIIWKHIKPNDVVLCLVDNHDEAYRRASRKAFSLEDGVIKMADILDVGAKLPEQHGGLLGWGQRGKARPGKLYVGYRDRELLDLGVPEDLLPHVRALEDLDALPQIERLLSPEVYNRLLEIALGEVERPVVPDTELRSSLERYEGGDDLCRFVDSEEFQRVLAGRIEDWMVFLAPNQRLLVNRSYNGPARIKGVAGSGKTVVAIHRARRLAQTALREGGRVLFFTYGNRLPGVIEHLLEHLAGPQAPELASIECATIHQWCHRYLSSRGLHPVADNTGDAYKVAVRTAIKRVARQMPSLRLWAKSEEFFLEEIAYSIKGRAIASLEDYLSLGRAGRGTGLQQAERRAVFAVYQGYQDELRRRGLWDFNDFVLETLRLIEAGDVPTGYSAAVVDEIQDLTEAISRLVHRIVPDGADNLFLVGDGLQRIYPGGYSLAKLDINVVGRSTLLRRNYRNTQEIMRAAHMMMRGQKVDDLEEAEETAVEPEYSVRHGDLPTLRCFPTPDEEIAWIAQSIAELKTSRGYQDRDIALLYRWRVPYQRLICQLLPATVESVELRRDAMTYFGQGAKHTTFHSAKGLEFKVVFVVGVTDGALVPRDDWSLEVEALEEYLARERRLLYVAMTRARDLLYLTCSRGQPSRFLNAIPPEYIRRET